ncbi:MAG: hypothetical protein LAO05_18590, partial [Acidobacteriia bacterium]|nr:hypothetical protein [Terriglobia bacterium]
MARRKPLVTQHLENVSGELLTAWWDLIAAHTKNRQGIYALYRRRKLRYVGLAKNLAGRLKIHLRDHHKGSWDRFSVYVTIGDQHMRELEALILRISKPVGNKIQGRFAKSENLLPLLRSEYRAEMKREEERLLGGKGGGKTTKRTQKVAGKSKATGRHPKLGPYVTRAFRIRARFKGKTYWARVRGDGTIRYAKKVYNSPSLAGYAVVGG